MSLWMVNWESAIVGLKCPDGGRADYERKMFFKSEIKEQK